MTPDQTAPADQLASYLGVARWFGGKGRPFTVTEVTELPLSSGVSTNLVQVSYDDGGTDLYQMPIAAYAEPQERLAHAAIGFWDGLHRYDAVHDREAMAVWLQAFADATPGTPVRFVRTADHAVDTETHSTLFSGEQSNSSLAFGEDALLKVFRRVSPGVNPDIEMHEALTRAGSTHIAELYGYVEADLDGDVLHLGMLQQFLRTASDGWDLALASARNVLNATDLPADNDAGAGSDFAAESFRLGVSLAEVHQVLAEAFGTGTLDVAAVATTMTRRLDAAVAVVPEIARVREPLVARFTAIGTTGSSPVQRVHGDLHLGQTLRTSLGWKLVDFEGEPAKDLLERQLPDSPWRDVAGMIRSFDYAAATVVADLTGDGEAPEPLVQRAADWTARNTEAFLAGYADSRGSAVSPEEESLLEAYIADKAVYEALYEARNRPGWLPIPLTALAALAEETR